MQRKILFLFLLSSISVYSFCQEDSIPKKEAKPKKVTHYFGVQANQLLRQLFSFSNSSPVLSNPYLISYAVNSNQTGWGFSSGFGYVYEQFSEGDALNPLETTINDFNARAGVERKIVIGKRWITGVGMDMLTEVKRDKTVSNSPFGNFTSRTKSVTFGMGPRFLLYFKVADRISLGTEASYYFKRTKQSQHVTGLPDTTDRFRNFSFAVPAILFLNVTF